MKNSNLLIYKKINKNLNPIKSNDSIIKKINNLIPILTILGLAFNNISYWIYYLHQSGIFDALKLPRNLIPSFNIIDSISFLFSYIPIILIGLTNYILSKYLNNAKFIYKVIYSIFSIFVIHFIISLTIFFFLPLANIVEPHTIFSISNNPLEFYLLILEENEAFQLNILILMVSGVIFFPTKQFYYFNSFITQPKINNKLFFVIIAIIFSTIATIQFGLIYFSALNNPKINGITFAKNNKQYIGVYNQNSIIAIPIKYGFTSDGNSLEVYIENKYSIIHPTEIEEMEKKSIKIR